MARFYSDITNKLYDTMADLEGAEKSFIEAKEEKKRKEQQKADERKARAQEVEDLRKAYIDARKSYTDALQHFCDDYGTFHTSVSSDNLFDFLWSWM